MRFAAFARLFRLFLAIPALFYLCVVPLLITSGPIKPFSRETYLACSFALFLYLQFWAVGVQIAYSSAASLYGFRERILLPRPFRLLLASTKSELKPFHDRLSAAGSILSVSLTYLWTLYGFAVAFVILGRFDEHAFNVGSLGIFDAFYFSLMTAATVGYGDIFPQSHFAKALVMAEVLSALAFAIFFFSILAGNVASKHSSQA